MKKKTTRHSEENSPIFQYQIGIYIVSIYKDEILEFYGKNWNELSEQEKEEIKRDYKR